MGDQGQTARQGFGPGVLVAAAFIGPGTVTTCVLAGQGFGTVLLWVLVFATVATIVLQEMAARLGAGARSGLGEALASASGKGRLRFAALGLVLTAIVIGNIAYEGGNLVGASLGAESLLGELDRRVVVPALALVAAGILLPGKYKLVEGVLIVFVMIMATAFLIAALFSGVGPTAIAKGLVPRVPDGALLPLIALLGTTIVPYNLFLHAAAAKRRFEGAGAVRAARRDTVLAVGLGGLVSAAILVSGAASSGSDGGIPGLASALEPAFGAAGRWVIGTGLLAAGLSSAITAPMAAGYVAGELFGGGIHARTRTIFRVTALVVLTAGAVTGSLGVRPETLILLAQAANGLLLPIVGVFLLVMMNRRTLLGEHANGALSNVLGGGVVLITLFFGLRGVARAFGVWP
ncbi:NRAMP family divalent metal transporter [Parvularcula lutaonensis]|uniref:NRAMP family divalent metal transporter n=1 Tax=Parvularcula lutaonensis TaxID=491923 RepID=A0ABV7M6X2_9PROT|nr:divalent metal cation transporter [Parvularcula lutaonensis]GGY56885.1 manganese transporter [Parvularcula lutaonensis]